MNIETLSIILNSGYTRSRITFRNECSQTKALRYGTREMFWMKEILSMEIENGVTIKLSDGTIIKGIKPVSSIEKTEEEIPKTLQENSVTAFLKL